MEKSYSPSLKDSFLPIMIVGERRWSSRNVQVCCRESAVVRDFSTLFVDTRKQEKKRYDGGQSWIGARLILQQKLLTNQKRSIIFRFRHPVEWLMLSIPSTPTMASQGISSSPTLGNTSRPSSSAVWIIVGASRGIGLEFVRQLLLKRERVYAVIRDPANASQLWSFAGVGIPNCEMLECDVSDESSIMVLSPVA